MKVAFGDAAVSTAACGSCHTAVVTEEGFLWTFGRGVCGALGHGDDRNQWEPCLVCTSPAPTPTAPHTNVSSILGDMPNEKNGYVRRVFSPQPSTQIRKSHVISVHTHARARKVFLTHALLFHSHGHNQEPTAKRARAHTHTLTRTHTCAHAHAVLAHADAGW